MKSVMIRIGNFCFTYRNKLFPFIMLALFMLAVPPKEILHSELLEHVKDVTAFLLVLSGLVLRAVVIGYAYIKRGGLNKKVYAEHLVTEGMFALCRNPLYVGNMLIYAGVFVMHGNPLVMVLGIATFAFIYQCIIYAEEAYLRDKFGEGYDAYCADVPRWLPRLGGFRAATEGMVFNWRKALVKDYSTIASTLVTVILVEMYEYVFDLRTAAESHYLIILSGLLLAVATAALLVRVLKKRKILTDGTAAG